MNPEFSQQWGAEADAFVTFDGSLLFDMCVFRHLPEETTHRLQAMLPASRRHVPSLSVMGVMGGRWLLHDEVGA